MDSESVKNQLTEAKKRFVSEKEIDRIFINSYHAQKTAIEEYDRQNPPNFSNGNEENISNLIYTAFMPTSTNVVNNTSEPNTSNSVRAPLLESNNEFTELQTEIKNQKAIKHAQDRF